jgi:hypothetical protein
VISRAQKGVRVLTCACREDEAGCATLTVQAAEVDVACTAGAEVECEPPAPARLPGLIVIEAQQPIEPAPFQAIAQFELEIIDPPLPFEPPVPLPEEWGAQDVPATVEVIPVLPCEEEEEIAAPRLAEDNTPAWMPYAESGEEEAEEGQEPPCADDPTLPYHCPGCPDSGCPRRITCPYSGRTIELKDESEPEQKEPQLPRTKGDDSARSWRIDTMEFRRSDAGLGEFFESFPFCVR